jgi:hypothetical protein
LVATAWTAAYRDCYSDNISHFTQALVSVLWEPSTHFEESKVWSVPRSEEDGRMGAVATKATRFPVSFASDAIPGLERHAVDTSNLIVRCKTVLAGALVGLKSKDVEVEEIR